MQIKELPDILKEKVMRPGGSGKGWAYRSVGDHGLARSYP